MWQPPFIRVPALGGFGVMNGDGEWKLINRTGNPRVVRVVCDDGSSFEVRLEETARIR